MLPRTHPALRRRSACGAHLCAVAAAILLLLVSLSVLHSLLLSSSPSPLSSTSPDTVLLADDDLVPDSVDPLPLDEPIDELDVLDEDADRSHPHKEESLRTFTGLDANSGDPDLSYSPPGALFWDHALGVARRPFGGIRSSDQWPGNGLPHDGLLRPDLGRIVIGSDDEPVDAEVRLKLRSISSIEDALLVKVNSGRHKSDSLLRGGWASWLEGKGDYLRRDRMLRSTLDLLSPKNHPLLQDPDGPGLTLLTRGDRLMLRVLLKEMEAKPFLLEDAGGRDAKATERRSLRSDGNNEEKTDLRGEKIVDLKEMGEQENVEEKQRNGHAQQWGYFPGIDRHLKFSEFMDRFLSDGRCSMRVFMVWNSPPWTYGIRHQRGLESLLRHHRDACVVLFSETLELLSFQDFVNEGYKVAVVLPNLDELLADTPAHVFASVWFEWRKTKHYHLHYSELIRLAALYKYGGIYLDSDIIVLKPLLSLHNSIGIEEQVAGNSSFSGAVMAFKKLSPFLMECLKEFYSTYDDTLLKWNGADLMTRVVNRVLNKADKSYGQLGMNIEPISAFYPISSTNITRYFAEPADEFEKAQQDALFMKIVDESFTFHLWNSVTSSLVPEPSSLVDRLLNHYCLHCLDVI